MSSISRQGERGRCEMFSPIFDEFDTEKTSSSHSAGALVLEGARRIS